MLTNITLYPEKQLGQIKPMHAVGQPPVVGMNYSYIKYLKEANIPYSRLHDVGGWFGGNMYVDIPNIFRDFSADVEDPNSYDFTFTDLLLAALLENNCEPYFRLGVTIENFHYIKSYRIDPPSDNDKWAKICEYIIRHYNEGWADGFHYNIKYWEIWNEPDANHTGMGNGCWNGTAEEFFELYRVASLHLRKCFGDTIKIGGYGHCGFYAIVEDKLASAMAMGSDRDLDKWEIRKIGFIDFFEKFIAMVVKENLPLDFFSHHSYSTVVPTVRMQKYVENYFEIAGLENVEIHLNEWNPSPSKETRGRSVSCANSVAMMCAMQNTKMAVMCFYDANIGANIYGGLFNPITYEPFCAYYGFKAFGRLYELGTQIECVCNNPNVHAISATNGETTAVLIANLGEDTEITLDISGKIAAHLIDENNMMTEMKIDINCFSLKENQVVLIEKRR